MPTTNRVQLFNFYLRFSDLCAFVPHTDGKRMRVLFPRCAKPTHASVGDPNQAHFPVVAFSAKDLRSARRVPYKTLKHGPYEEEIGFWFLENQDLEISTSRHGKEQSLTIDSSYFEHVADMSRIPGCDTGEVNKSCLTYDSDDVPQQYVSARVALTEGTLKVKQLTLDEKRNEVRWVFKMSPTEDTVNENHRVLALQLELEIPRVEYVKFTAKAFNDSSTKETMYLASSREDLIVEIKNEPAEEILRLPWDYASEEEERAKHFELFYSLLHSPPPLEKRIPYIQKSGPITSTSIYCPPAGFRPHEDA